MQLAKDPYLGGGSRIENSLESGLFVQLEDFLTNGDKKYTEAAYFTGHQLQAYGYHYEYEPSDSLGPGHPFLRKGAGCISDFQLEHLETNHAILRIKNNYGGAAFLLNRNLIDIALVQANEANDHKGLYRISDRHLYRIYPRYVGSLYRQPYDRNQTKSYLG